jgi:hypothetical protein
VPNIAYLDAFGISWAIVADRPTLRDTSDMTRQLTRLCRCPEPQAYRPDDFAAWQRCWEAAGVFTLASEFRDDGHKGGEFEAFLRQHDADLLDSIKPT